MTVDHNVRYAGVRHASLVSRNTQRGDPSSRRISLQSAI